MKTTLLLVGSFSVYAANAAASAPIDDIQQFKMNILPHGASANVVLHITGTSMEAPFKWTIKFTDPTGNTVLYLEGDDSEINRTFGPKQINNCDGYEDCKRRWYFDYFQKTTRANGTFFSDRMPPEDAEQLAKTRKLVEEFLATRKVSKARQEAAIKEIVKLNANGGFGLVWSMKNLDLDELYMYVPSLGYFVPIAEHGHNPW